MKSSARKHDFFLHCRNWLIFLLVAVSGHAQAQMIDASIHYDAYTFTVKPIDSDGAAYLLPKTEQVYLGGSMCEPWIVCIAQERVGEDNFGVLQQSVSLAGNRIDGTVFSGGLGGHVSSHLAPATAGTVNYRLTDFLNYTISPYTELTVDFHVVMGFDTAIPASIPYSGSAEYNLLLYFPDGGGTTSYLARLTAGDSPVISSPDGNQNMLDESGFLRLTNMTAMPLEVRFRTDAYLLTSLDMPPPIQEPANAAMLVAGLLILRLSTWRRASKIRVGGLASLKARIAGLSIASLAVTVSPMASAQILDAGVHLGVTSVQIGSELPQSADFRYVWLTGDGRQDGENVSEVYYRDTLPESFSHHLNFGESWTDQDYLGDESGAAAALHWELPAAPRERNFLRSEVTMRLDIWLQPGEAVFVNTPIQAMLAPSAVTSQYSLMAELFATITVDELGSTDDVARISSFDGEPASLEEILSVEIWNPFSWAVPARLFVTGRVTAIIPTVSQVPEAGEHAMLLTGLLLLGAVRLFRNCKRTIAS